jgi:hypothetical protein
MSRFVSVSDTPASRADATEAAREFSLAIQTASEGSAAFRTAGLIEFDAFVMNRDNRRRPAPSR